MKLSVVVVTRNACMLLKQALYTLTNACKGIDYELIVVDNASTDQSMEMLVDNFPEAILILNETDHGMAKSSNQALKECTGEYILLVSPDTISGKDTVEKMIDFMDQHPDAGGMAVRMISPQGRFLPESIHGLNKQWAAFLKFIGFARHLSKTRLYDRNRKEWVEEFQVAEVDILTGDYTMIRHTALTEAGLFDERFFRYGHNVDLSYRLRLAGFKNYYFPKTFIINFESRRTAKISLTHMKYFYGAMIIFAVKYLLRVPEIKMEGIPQLFHSSYEVK